MANAAGVDIAVTYAAVNAGVSTTVPLLDHHTARHTSTVDHFALVVPGHVGERKDIIAAVNKQAAAHGRKYTASGNVSPFRTHLPTSHLVTYARFASPFRKHLSAS